MIPKESRIASIWFSVQQVCIKSIRASPHRKWGSNYRKILNFAASYPYSNLDMVCAVVIYSRFLLVSDIMFRWEIRSIISLNLWNKDIRVLQTDKSNCTLWWMNLQKRRS